MNPFGIVATIVQSNPKCTSCLHYLTGRSICQLGLYPSGCGDGSVPEMGFAPVTASGGPWTMHAEVPGNPPGPQAVSPQPQPLIPINVTRLGDVSELLALSSRVLPDMMKACKQGCAAHGGSPVAGATSFAASEGFSHCSCQELDVSEAARTVYAGLSNVSKAHINEKGVEDYLTAALEKARAA